MTKNQQFIFIKVFNCKIYGYFRSICVYCIYTDRTEVKGCYKLNIIISNSSEEPIYLQIVNQIKEHIVKGDLVESHALPSIRNLAKELKISVITTKRAYDELEKEGFIVTVAGKGSYVAAINKEVMRETKVKRIEEKMTEAITTAKLAGLTLEELQEMLKLLYEG